MKLQSGVQKRERQRRALNRLKSQLAKGSKAVSIPSVSNYAFDIRNMISKHGYDPKTPYKKIEGKPLVVIEVPYTQDDRSRIEKEIEVLESRI